MEKRGDFCDCQCSQFIMDRRSRRSAITFPKLNKKEIYKQKRDRLTRVEMRWKFCNRIQILCKSNCALFFHLDDTLPRPKDIICVCNIDLPHMHSRRTAVVFISSIAPLNAVGQCSFIERLYCLTTTPPASRLRGVL